jgi:hypothetical protein
VVLGRYLALTDAEGKVLRRILIPDGTRGLALIALEQRVRAEYGVDDVTLFLRDSALDQAP